jgi:hypothetical protein
MGLFSTKAPRGVFLGAVRALGKTFEADGFTHLKSGTMKRVVAGSVPDDALVDEIHFASSSKNSAGALVKIDPALWVSSKGLAPWRTKSGSPLAALQAGGRVTAIAAGNIGNLPGGGGYAMWNVADDRSRPDVLRQIEAEIRRLVLPFADQVHDVRLLIGLARLNSVVINVASAIEFCIMGAGAEAGREYFERWWAVLPPGFRQTVINAIADLENPRGRSRHPLTGHHGTAAVTLHYGWKALAIP